MMAGNRGETHSTILSQVIQTDFETRILYFKPLVILWVTLWTAPFPNCCNQSNTRSTAHV